MGCILQNCKWFVLHVEKGLTNKSFLAIFHVENNFVLFVLLSNVSFSLWLTVTGSRWDTCVCNNKNKWGWQLVWGYTFQQGSILILKVRPIEYLSDKCLEFVSNGNGLLVMKVVKLVLPLPFVRILCEDWYDSAANIRWVYTN